MAEDDMHIPRLVVTEPAEQAGLILSLSRPEIAIGHSDVAGLVLEGRLASRVVSRHQALVTVDLSGQAVIRDLNSTGVTFVNDERLEGPRILRPGDLVRLAGAVARFEPGSSPGDPHVAAETGTRLLGLHGGAGTPPWADAEGAAAPGRQRSRATAVDHESRDASDGENPAGDIGPQPHRIRMPRFVTGEEIGLGDVVKRGTYAIGIKPCAGCEKRAAALNRWMHFTR